MISSCLEGMVDPELKRAVALFLVSSDCKFSLRRGGMQRTERTKVHDF